VQSQWDEESFAKPRLMSNIEHLVLTYGPLIVFLWTLFEGETVVVVAGYLVHQGLLAPVPVVVAAFLGSVLSDQIIFFIGRHHVAERYVARVKHHRYFARALQWVEHRPTLFIFSFRFLYGLRTVGALAVSLTSVSALRFTVVNTMSAAIWAIAFTMLGYALGQTVEAVFGRLHAVEHKIGWGLVIGLAFFGLYQLIKARLRRAKENAAEQ
jgi:membrane protein DedA with SNARE-associated domain